MLQIQHKVTNLIQSGTKNAYQKAIDYLLRIIAVIIDPSDSAKNHGSINVHKNQRLLSQQKKLGNRQNFNVTANKFRLSSNDEKVSQEQFSNAPQFYEGNQISFIEKLNKRVDQNMRKRSQQQEMQRKTYKLNRRGLQQTIQVYHQCLEKSLEVIKMQYNKLAEHTQLNKVPITRLDNFWIKFITMKNESKTFDDLIRIARFQLAKQFLTVINPFKYQGITNGNFPKNPVKYRLFYEKNNESQ